MGSCPAIGVEGSSSPQETTRAGRRLTLAPATTKEGDVMYPERSSGALSPDDDNDCDFRDAAAEAELEAEVAAGEAQGSISSSSQQPEEAAEESSEGPAGGAAAGGDTVAVNAGGGSSGPHQPKKRYVGVRQRPSGRWVAEIKDTTHKIRLWLGTFNNPEDAARAYDDAARTLRGANTRTNFTRPLGTRPGFSSNSVRLLLQKAVEAAAVAGNLDSGGVLPSVAAAAGGGGGGAGASSSSSAAAVPSSFAATSNAPQDPGPSNFMGGFHSDSELEEALRQRQRADSPGASNLFGQLNPRHGISRSVSYDQATMMRSQAAGPGPGSNPNLRLYTSFSGDFSGSHALAAAPSGSFDLQQMQQMSNVRQSGTTFGAPGYEAQPPDRTDRATQQGSSSSRYHAQFNIYESLREKLGYGPPTPTSTGGHGTGDAGFAFNRDGTTSAFAATTTGAEAVDNMDLGWDPNPSVESGGSLIQHWGRSAGTDMLISRVHEQQPTIPDHVQQQQQQQQASRRMNESWEHGNVGSRGHEAAAAADHERFGLEEIATVNWGNLGTSSTGDAAAHDTMSPLNWEDLGRTLATSSSEQQRPVERLTTINWGDLISRTTASGEAQRMEGITNNVTSWGPGNMGGFAAPNSWTSGPAAGHGPGHHHFPATPLPASSSHEYWEAAAAAQTQVPTGMGHLQESHDRQLQMQSSSSRPGLWATSSSQPQYAQDATFPQRVITREASLSARPADPERLPNIQQQHGSQVEAATRQPTGSEQDSESAEEDLDLPRGSQQQGDSTTSETQGRFIDYSSMDPTNRDTMASSLSGLLSHNQADQADSGLNFLMLSPGFFRMDSFQRREPSTPANIVALADHETDDATEQDADLISADDLPGASSSVGIISMDDEDSRRARPSTAGSPLSEVQTTVALDPSLAGIVRPKLVRINAARLPEVGVDDADDRSPTRSQVLGEAVRSHLVLGGSVITTQDLVAATRSASDPDVTHASDAPFQQALPDQR